MADPAAAQVQAPAPTAPQPAPAPAGHPLAGRAARGERRMAAIAKVQSSAPVETAAPSPTAAPAPAAPKTEINPPKPAEPALEKPDPATDRSLRTIEQARKKFLDEQNAAKAELDVQRAEIARLRKEAEGKVASREDLKKLSPTELLEALEHFGEDEFDILSRTAYARTKAGKVDPRAQTAAQEASRAQGGRAAQAEIAALKAQVEEMKTQFAGEFTRRDQASFAEHWIGEAVKTIPTDTPSFLGKQLANKPDVTRRELLTIGAELEKENGGEAPTHAEVIAEFEKRKRDSLTAMGLDPDALLAPPKPAEPAAAAKPVTRTLNVTAPSVTRPENAPKTREERRAGAIAKIRAQTRTADQT